MPGHTDTIAALATPTGTSAIAVIRTSGPDTPAIAAALCGRPPLPRTACCADYRAIDGELLDAVLLTWFQGPKSYTGEDVLEICCHGNPFIAQRILEDLFARGCRPAGPGEFTQRAFLNGKLELTEAEAVMDLIRASSERALAAANQQLRGGLARRLAIISRSTLSILAQIEAYIDFPEEDLPPEDLTKIFSGLGIIILDINRLLSTERFGSILRDGLTVVILGAPNAGKSSLLNRLVGRERALVSSEAGTTRDFIEERIHIGRHSAKLIDTAGINPRPTPIERLGIAKTMEQLEAADIVLLVIDSSTDTALHSAQNQMTPSDRTIVVLNKSDLPLARIDTLALHGKTTAAVSALTGLGIEELKSAICDMADIHRYDAGDGIAINSRHAHALKLANQLLVDASAKLRTKNLIELVSSDLREALSVLGEISEGYSHHQLLDELFVKFCIGK